MTWPQYQRGECTVDGRPIFMPRLRTEILSTLLMRRGCVVSCYELSDLCWPDPDDMPDRPEDNVKVHVCKLRTQMPDVIETVWGRGYRIPLPDETLISFYESRRRLAA